MTRYIDADELSIAMYEEAMVKDSDMQKWDSGCWIRYKLFENVLKAQKTVDLKPERVGKWDERFVEDENPFFRRRFYCTACGHWNTYGTPNYCPDCGARMIKDEKTD